MFSLLNKAKDAQQKMKEAQDNLHSIVVTAEAGGGMVTATVNGAKQVLKLDIDPTIINDIEMVQDLCVAAINIALRNADEKAKEYMQNAMEGMIPAIPGIDLQSFFKT
ncbi:MAG: YbaB/EbfC family nucleoid-associated protein [Cytophagales bacterium]|nr:YbaB/EbfC family nucleoid-associated protein [Cytophagales bacterium]